MLKKKNAAQLLASVVRNVICMHRKSNESQEYAEPFTSPTIHELLKREIPSK